MSKPQQHKIVRISSILTIDFGYYSDDDVANLLAACEQELEERSQDSMKESTEVES